MVTIGLIGFSLSVIGAVLNVKSAFTGNFDEAYNRHLAFIGIALCFLIITFAGLAS